MRSHGHALRSALLALLTVALLAGCGRAPTPTPSSLPSGLVDVGNGRHLEVSCSGSGGPVVVLEAGLGNTSEVWLGAVQHVEAFTTVCAYDRAGLGGSDPRPEPHGAASAVIDLHALLDAIGLPGPFILVGASYGGLVTQLYARTFPGDVAGVVFVDSLAPAWDRELEAILSTEQVAERRAIPNGEPLTNEDIRASEDDVAAGPPFPEVPLVVLRHGRPLDVGPGWPSGEIEKLWASQQADLAALSPRSVLITAATSGHRIHEDQPELVADAIHAIVDPQRWPPIAPQPPAAFGVDAPPVGPGELSGSFVWGAADGLHIANADGSGDRVLLGDAERLLGEPTIDSAGHWLAFTKRDRPSGAGGPQPEAGSEIWLLDLRSGATSVVIDDGQMPAIAPDGSAIAFTRRGHVLVISLDGAELDDLGEAGCPVWAPDSADLALCTSQDATYVLRPPDGPVSPIIVGGNPTTPAAWSPDGRTLALYSTRDGDGDIYRIERDGSGERRLTRAAGNQAVVAWLPEGLLVTSSLPDADTSDWFLLDPVTLDVRAIPWLNGIASPVAWRRLSG
jgi:pimeloyl-ACP methyl ester carboxylesterase